MKMTLSTTYRLERLNNSRNGNPRYELREESTGNIIATTRPDSSIAYGEVPNNAGKSCVLTIHETPSGRRYVDKVELQTSKN